MIKIILLVLLAIFLGTVIENVYAKRGEICDQASVTIADETSPVGEKLDNKKPIWEEVKGVYNEGINKATIGLLDVVKKFKCEETNKDTNLEN